MSAPSSRSAVSNVRTERCEAISITRHRSRMYQSSDRSRSSTSGETRSETVGRLDRREPDERDRVALADVAVVELAEELAELVGMSDLRVVVLDLVRRELAD